MKRKICSITIILILIIIGLFKSGIALFEYKRNTEGKFNAVIYSKEKESKYMDIYVGKIKNQKFLLYVKKGSESIELGDNIEFYGSYSKPEGQRNYKGFDYNLYLKTKKISGIFKVDKFIKAGKTNTIYILWKKKISRIKSMILHNIYINLKKENSALLSGILLGDDSNISNESLEKFKKLSLIHLLAISGENFMYIVLLFDFINKKVKLKRIGYYTTIIGILFFMELTGNSASVFRAGVMCIVQILAKLLHRKYDVWTSIAISAIIQMVYNPYSIFDIGLLLSYGGVVGIVMLYPKIKNKIKSELLCGIICANIIIIPISVYSFNEISLMFIISNIFASLFIEIVTILGCISIVFRFRIIFFILDFLLSIFNYVVKLLSSIPFSSIKITTPSLMSIIMYYVFIMIIYNKKRLTEYYKSILTVCLILIVTLNINFQVLDSVINKKLLINFVDVGQGDCTLLRYKNKNVLIDGGGNQENDYDIGKNILIPYLLDRKIKIIDFMIVSHFDTDHVGGLLAVMEELNVRTAVISKQGKTSENYETFSKIAREKNISIVVVGIGDKVQIDSDLYFDILWPNNSRLMSENWINNNSIVCKLHYKRFSCLFTGDIEEVAERKILEEYSGRLQILNSTILKVGHHGSKTSSTEEFLSKINPKICMIGVGKNNKFGHPNETVLKRLKKMNCNVYRTDLDGEVSISIDEKIRIKKFIK